MENETLLFDVVQCILLFYKVSLLFFLIILSGPITSHLMPVFAFSLDWLLFQFL
jgi:hypothetical protein